MRKAFWACLVILLGLQTSFAQTNFSTDYTPLQSSGTLPKELTIRYTDKFALEKDKIKNEQGKKKKEEFLKKSTYLLNEILKGGRILFNEPLSNYTSTVADNLLANDKTLRNKLSFFVLKSTAVNAFTTNEGFIFVTTGLLAQIENEAQLAFVLSHEIMHYKEKHAMERYIESEQISKNAGEYRGNQSTGTMIAKCLFSKEQEKEADEKGLELFLKSKYSTASITGVYDVLKYAELPIDDIAFNKDFFENPGFKFPLDYQLTSTKPIDTEDKPEEEESTHPSIRSRREKMLSLISGKDNSSNQEFIQPKEKFEEARELARFELARLYNINEQYAAGIYHCYILLKKYPENKYLKKNIAYALTAIASYRNQGRMSETYKTMADSAQGKQQALFHLLGKISGEREEFNSVALAYVTGLKQQYKDDVEINNFYTHLIKQMVYENDKSISYYYDKVYVPSALPEFTKDSLPDIMHPDTTKVLEDAKVEEEETGSKYDKIRSQEKEKESGTGEVAEQVYYRYVLSSYVNIDWFKKDFGKIQDAHDKDSESGGPRLVTVKDGMTKLGIDDIVIVTPNYMRLNAQKKEKFKYVQSDRGQADFANRLQFVAKRAKLNVQLLDNKNVKGNEVEKLNDISFMSEYIGERLNQDDDDEVFFPALETSRALKVAAKYKADNFMWNGAISFQDKNRINAFLVVYCIILPPALPFFLPAIIRNGNYTYLYSIVYNVKDDNFQLMSLKTITERTSASLLNSHLYDTMLQVKTKRK